MIEVHNLQKKFDGRGIAGLSDVSFGLPTGKIAAILGPNGSGKSTLLKSLLGQLKLDSGEVKISETVHFIETQTPEFQGSVQDYLISKVKISLPDDKKIQLSRDFAQIFEFTSQLKQPLNQVSTGQKQKILISGELINSPDTVLMDEPFTHLDPLTRKEILKTLFTYLRQKEITTLWVTHELSEASRFSDYVGVLQHGHLEQWGEPSEVFLKPKNLFVASFLGYENFIAVKAKNSSWETTWGEMEFNFQSVKPDAILVIPRDSFELDQDSNFQVTIEELYPENSGWTHHLIKEEQHFVLWSREKLGPLGTRLRLKPKSNSSFLIAL